MPEGRLVTEESPAFGGGVSEHPELAGPGWLESGFNIEFKDGTLRKRRGRFRLTRGFVTSPSRVVMLRYAADRNAYVDFSDITAQMTDNDAATEHNLNGFRGTGGVGNPDSILVGCPFPFDAVRFQIQAGTGNTTASTLSVRYWDGSGYVNRTIGTDGTSSGGATMAQTGYVRFGSIPTDWRPEQLLVAQTSTGAKRIPSLYWLHFRCNNTLSNVGANIALEEVRIDVSGLALTDGTAIDNRTPINGIIYAVLPSGERQILVGMDDQTNGVARLFQFIYGRNEFRAIQLPPDLAGRTGPGAQWRGVLYGGKLILYNGFTPLLVYDGQTCEPLNGLWGRDAGIGKNPRTYVPPPIARFLAVYNSSLYAYGVEGAPRVLQWSETDNALNVFTGSEAEQVGGANYWPSNQAIDIQGGDAGKPETSSAAGIAMLGGRLAVLTRERAYLFDDSPLLLALGGNSGCTAPNSVVSVGEACFYLGDRQVLRLDSNGRVTPVSSPQIERTMREYMNSSAAQGAVAVVSTETNEYRLYIPVNGDQRNRLCLVYNYVTGQWVTRGGIPPWAPTTLTTSTNPFNLMDTFNVSAVAKVSDPGVPETILTGGYTGDLWLEDEGESDSDFDSVGFRIYNAIFAYVVTHRFGKDSAYLKWFREFRLDAKIEGAVTLSGLLCYDGEDAVGALASLLIENRTGERVTVSLSGDGIVPSTEDEAWFQNGASAVTTHVPVIDTNGSTAARWSTREFRNFKLSFQPESGNRSPRDARTAQVVLWQGDAQMPFEIRRWAFDYTTYPEARR